MRKKVKIELFIEKIYQIIHRINQIQIQIINLHKSSLMEISHLIKIQVPQRTMICTTSKKISKSKELNQLKASKEEI